MQGYKVFNSDWTCKGFQYEVGKEYIHEGKIEICRSGFHFCEKAIDCFNYYKFDIENKVALVETMEDAEFIKHESDSKICTNKIRIVKALSWGEVLELVNIGKGNTGRSNSGDSNSGDSNSGDCNSGHCNSGHCNSGHRNSGHCNSGDRNSGDWNSGDSNSGDWNSGHRNSGHCNSGHSNSGDSNSG